MNRFAKAKKNFICQRNAMNNSIQNCDKYKSLEEIAQPDERGIAIFQTTDLENWHQFVLKQLPISEHIPDDIRIQIENAKNLYLYSWFEYRFGIVAKNQMLNVTELALRKKFELEKIEEPRSMRIKLEKALSEGWFDNYCFPHIEKKSGKEASLNIIEAITGIRNELNHGSTMLYDPLNLIGISKNCLNIIDSIFRTSSKL